MPANRFDFRVGVGRLRGHLGAAPRDRLESPGLIEPLRAIFEQSCLIASSVGTIDFLQL